MTLTSRTGESLTFARILTRVTYESRPLVSRFLILSNGQVIITEDQRYSAFPFNTGEWLCLETLADDVAKDPLIALSQTIDLVHISDVSLRQIKAVETSLFFGQLKVVAFNAGDNDTAQECLQSWLTWQVRYVLGSLMQDPENALDLLTGQWQGMTIRHLLDGIFHRGSMLPAAYRFRWDSMSGPSVFSYLLEEIRLHFASYNLLEQPLEQLPLFDVTLVALLNNYARGQQVAEATGKKLLQAIACKYGWVRNKHYRRSNITNGWSKLHKGKPVIHVDDRLQVFVKDSFCCVVDATSDALLPWTDKVASRLLALSTNYRDQITTLQPYQDFLREVFHTCDPRSLDEIRQELASQPINMEEEGELIVPF